MINVKILFHDLQIFAHKKGGGSTRNGRDSKSKFLGIKRHQNQLVRPGTIIYMQRGTKIHPGKNVKRGNNDALYSTVIGKVNFHYISRKKRAVSVVELEN